MVLWVVLIVLGTFLRGPNWNFFGPFEYWDPHKVVPLNNVNLSDYFWLQLAGHPSRVDTGMRSWLSSASCRASSWCSLYLFVLPPLLARTVFRPFFIKMGFVRFFMLITLLAVHGRAADQDGAALDHQPEVHRVHSGILLQHLTRFGRSHDRRAASLTRNTAWPQPTRLIAARKSCTSSSR